MRKWLVGVAFALAASACDGDTPSSDAGLDAAVDAGVDGSRSCSADVDCDDGVFCNGVERCAPADSAADGRGCAPGAGCGTDEVCDEVAGTCTPSCPDADLDGRRSILCGGDDCDDDDANRLPGNTEVCDVDGHDEDCDPRTFGYRDIDGDGYPDMQCCNTDGAGTMRCGDDCNDMAGGVHPGESDGCDGRDNDCDGMTDEEGMLLYLDCDGDGFGSSMVFREGCPEPVSPSADCPSPLPSSTWTTTPGDCDDARAATNPAATEGCEAAELDDDCDTLVNEGCACSTGATRACGTDVGACSTGTQTCIAGAWESGCAGSTMPSTEVCNGVDDDCNGMTDEGCPCAPVGSSRACSAEGRLGACAVGTETCAATGWMGCAAPGTETCGGPDEDCDGATDEELHVWQVPMAILSLPGCSSSSLHRSHACAASVSAACLARTPPAGECGSDGGFGHVEIAGPSIESVCIDATREAFTPGTAIRPFFSPCTTADADYPNCRVAINRYCQSRGMAGGFGYADGADSFAVFCLSYAQAQGFVRPWSDFAAIAPACASSPPDPIYCPHAAHRWCIANGFAAGFGPVEQNATGMTVICIRDY